MKILSPRLLSIPSTVPSQRCHTHPYSEIPRVWSKKTYHCMSHRGISDQNVLNSQRKFPKYLYNELSGAFHKYNETIFKSSTSSFSCNCIKYETNQYTNKFLFESIIYTNIKKFTSSPISKALNLQKTWACVGHCLYGPRGFQKTSSCYIVHRWRNTCPKLYPQPFSLPKRIAGLY